MLLTISTTHAPGSLPGFRSGVRESTRLLPDGWRGSLYGCAVARCRSGRVVFECAKPPTVIVTTPNVEYNVRFDTLPAGKFRHKDHRFEWTRGEFQAWANGVAQRFGYAVRFAPVGPEDCEVGSPTQMGVFDMEAER